MPSFHIDLSLLDVSEEVRKDPSAIRLRQKIQAGIWETVCAAETVWNGNTATREGDNVQAGIVRFLRTSDKYLACASVLFKSRAFHQVYDRKLLDWASGTTNTTKPVVELPRTEYRKPYIPLPRDWREMALASCEPNTAKEEDFFSMSVSHQFPFAGMAAVVHNKVEGHDEQSSAQQNLALHCAIHPPIVGLDIVVFDKYNSRLYASEEEFLEVFQDQFTPNEWKKITHTFEATTTTTTTTTSPLKEFYIRWEMKEAYTKAIGMGMGLAFSSFEIHLEGTEMDPQDVSSTASLWSRIKTNNNINRDGNESPTTSPVCFRGTIAFEMSSSSNDKENEFFDFYFLPLDSPAHHPYSDEAREGCACVCASAFGRHAGSVDNEWRDRIRISWTDLERLELSHEFP